MDEESALRAVVAEESGGASASASTVTGIGRLKVGGLAMVLLACVVAVAFAYSNNVGPCYASSPSGFFPVNADTGNLSVYALAGAAAASLLLAGVFAATGFLRSSLLQGCGNLQRPGGALAMVFAVLLLFVSASAAWSAYLGRRCVDGKPILSKLPEGALMASLAALLLVAAFEGHYLWS